MTDNRPNPFGCFDRRYLIELIPAFAALATALVLVGVAPRTPATRILLAGLASAALAWTFVVTVAATRRLDEMQQRIHLIAIAVSFTATGVVAAVMRFFQVAGLHAPPTGIDLCGFMLLVWTGGVMVLNRRYR